MKKGETDFQKSVRDGYERGVPPGEIARQLGSTINSIKVTAHKIGVSDQPHVAGMKRRARKWLA